LVRSRRRTRDTDRGTIVRSGHVEVGEVVVVDGDVHDAATGDDVISGSVNLREGPVGVIRVAGVVAGDQAQVRVVGTVARHGGIARCGEVPRDAGGEVAGVDVSVDILETVVGDGRDGARRRYAEGKAAAAIRKAVAVHTASAVGIPFEVHGCATVGQCVVRDRHGRTAAIEPDTASPSCGGVAVTVCEGAVTGEAVLRDGHRSGGKHRGVDGQVVQPAGIAAGDAGDETVVPDDVPGRLIDEDGARLGGVVAEELEAVEGHRRRGGQGVFSVDDGLGTACSVMGNASVRTVDGQPLVEGQVLFKSHGSEGDDITCGGSVNRVLDGGVVDAGRAVQNIRGTSRIARVVVVGRVGVGTIVHIVTDAVRIRVCARSTTHTTGVKRFASAVQDFVVVAGVGVGAIVDIVTEPICVHVGGAGSAAHADGIRGERTAAIVFDGIGVEIAGGIVRTTGVSRAEPVEGEVHRVADRSAAVPTVVDADHPSATARKGSRR